MVALSIRPMRCRPAAVSWMAADKRLRYLVELAFFLIIAPYLPQFLFAPAQLRSARRCNSDSAWPAFSGRPIRKRLTPASRRGKRCVEARGRRDARPPLSLRRCRHATVSYIAGGAAAVFSGPPAAQSEVPCDL